MHIQSADNVLNPQTDIHFAIRTSFGDTAFPHAHDFFEFFLILEGTQEYASGNTRRVLQPGSLVLVRPGEAHSRKFLTPGKHINVAFSPKAADALFAYLGPGFPAQELLDLSNIPSAVLLRNEKEDWKNRLEELGALNVSSPEVIRTRLRIILLELFAAYFVNYRPETREHENGWFHSMLLEMNSKENFVAGVPRMMELSGRSNEHICRLFSRKKGCTPTWYVNRLRIHYAANLLLVSDYGIADICYDSGFNSLSHFYHVFQKEFGCSPGAFRQGKQLPPGSAACDSPMFPAQGRCF